MGVEVRIPRGGGGHFLIVGYLVMRRWMGPRDLTHHISYEKVSSIKMMMMMMMMMIIIIIVIMGTPF